MKLLNIRRKGKEQAMIKYKCSSCRSKLETDDFLSGKQEVCPVCKKVNPVPLSKHDKAEQRALVLARKKAKQEQDMRLARAKQAQDMRLARQAMAERRTSEKEEQKQNLQQEIQALASAVESEPTAVPRQSESGRAILTCHACEKIMAKELKKCPHCGATRKPTKEEQFASNAWAFGCLIPVLIFILIGIYSCSPSPVSERERKIREMSDETGIPMDEIRKNADKLEGK